MTESKAAISRATTLVAEEDEAIEWLCQQMKEAKKTIQQSLGIPVSAPPRQLRRQQKKRKSIVPEEAGI